MCMHYRDVKLTFSSQFHHVRALSRCEIDIFSQFHHVHALSKREIDIFSHFHHVHALSRCEIDISSHFHHVRALSRCEIDIFSHFHHVHSLSKREIDIFSHFHHVRALSICEIDIISHFHHVHALSQREIDIFQSFPSFACTIETWNWHFSVISIICVHYRNWCFHWSPPPSLTATSTKLNISKILNNSGHLSPSLHFMEHQLWMKSLTGGGGGFDRHGSWC